jgi:two-component sensor histidine kinase/PAS domain-containing protein
MQRLQHPLSQDLSVRSFVLGGAIMAVAVGARAAMEPLLPGLPPFITLYPAVALVGLLCGPLAGGIIGVTGLIAAVYLWIPPRLAFVVASPTDRISIVLFVSASSVMLYAVSLLRKQLDAATIARHALELGLAAGEVGTWEMNLETRRITASSTAFHLHGLAELAAPTVAENWLRGVHPDDAAAATATLRAAIAAGTQASYTYRIFGAGEGTRWISARGRVVAAGGERRLLCALVDITDQVRAQDELRLERERLRLAIAAGSLAVWDYDIATGAATIDPRYARTLGFDPQMGPVTRAQIGERIHPEDRLRVAAEHEAIIANDADYQIEYRVIAAGGEIRWVVSQGIVLKGDNPSDPGRMVGIIQDITDRKRREDSLRELAATREMLVREADHRIKNSLQLVMSLLTFQLRGIEDPAAKDALRGAITRVGAIAASHLALQGSEDLKDVDLAVTLRDLCGHFAQLHPGIAIDCRPDETLMLDADRAIPLGLVVSELLTNALRHAFPSRRSGTVVVEAMKERSELIIRVSDDGVGMPPGDRGGGLGSRIIRALATQVAAAIDFESKRDIGTVATLRLPLVQREPAGAL